jgi:predicted MFS family arabinose efflux permease
MTEPRSSRAVWTALGLAAGPASAFAFARFAYAVLLPPMQADLGWSYATAALLNTTNAAGYLLGAILAARIGRALGSRRAFLSSMVVTAAALGASALTSLLPVLLVLRLAAGISGAVTFILGAALTAALASQLTGPRTAQRSALLMGIYVSGGGMGVVVTGLLLPAALAWFPPESGWRVGWAALGIAGVAAWLIAMPAARRAPSPPPRRAGSRAPVRALFPLLAGYTLFGAGYIAYMTFIVALLRGQGAGDVEVAVFWIVLGLAAMVGGFAWSPVVGALSGGRAPALLMVVVALGAGLPLLADHPVLALGSAVLFGGTFLALVGAVTHAAQRVLDPSQVTDGIGTLTTGFAIGQSIGPVLSGVASDSADGVHAGLALSVAILLVGAVVFLGQRPQVAHAERQAQGR